MWKGSWEKKIFAKNSSTSQAAWKDKQKNRKKCKTNKKKEKKTTLKKSKIQNKVLSIEGSVSRKRRQTTNPSRFQWEQKNTKNKTVQTKKR